MKPFLIHILIAILLTGCSTYSDREKSDFDREIRAYLKATNRNCQKSESGLYYDIPEEGEGEYILFKDEVSFTYKGTFTDGTVFDEQKEPVTFNVSQLIGAWKEIMLQLKPGGKAFLAAPPQLGYGTHNLDDIPPNSILIYEIEITGVR